MAALDTSLQQQIDEVRLVVINRKAWLARRAELQRMGKTVPADTGCTAETIPGLEAAILSLEFLRDNYDEIRRALL